MVNTATANSVRNPAACADKLPGANVFDVCIIGSGVVGTALALYLADHDIAVALVESNFSEQERIVGELLQPDGYRQLVAMGLEKVLSNIDAITIQGYALLMDDKSIQVRYPENAFGKGMQNGKFVQALRNEAFLHKNIHTIEGKASQLLFTGDDICGVNVQLTSKENISLHAQLTVAADGFFSTFRKDLHQQKPELTGFFVGLILENIELPYANYGHVFMNTEAPVLCYPIATNKYRILIDFEPQHIPKKGTALNNHLLQKIKPLLPENMHAAFEKAVYENGVRSMSNHRLPGSTNYKRGAAILGDALNMRHPLTGGGMTVGLTDAKKIGDLIIQHNHLETLHDRLREFYTANRTYNATINILADALYGVVKDRELSEACYTYLSRGGTCESVPVSLLAGLNRNKKALIYHFFKVALYGALHNFLKTKDLEGIRSSYRIVQNAFHLVRPLMESEQLYFWEKIILLTGKKIF